MTDELMAESRNALWRVACLAGAHTDEAGDDYEEIYGLARPMVDKLDAHLRDHAHPSIDEILADLRRIRRELLRYGFSGRYIDHVSGLIGLICHPEAHGQ